jgi:hypothetical protein
MPTRSEDDMMKADKLIILSKMIADRCLAKFYTHFLQDESAQTS